MGRAMKKITIQIAYFDGTHHSVSGYALTTNFAAIKQRTRSWTITHLPTGLHVPYSTTTGFAEALVLATKFEKLHDWSKAKRGNDIPKSVRIAVIRAAKGSAFSEKWLAKERAKARLERAQQHYEICEAAL
jgi:hypothetical protein